MSVVTTSEISLTTRGDGDIIDLTALCQERLSESGLTEGSAILFVPGSTAAITTIEYEPGLLKDLPALFEKLIPSSQTYQHDETWGDGNGFSHLRAALVGPNVTLPFAAGKLILGTWQQMVLLEFDNRGRDRSVIIQFSGN